MSNFKDVLEHYQAKHDREIKLAEEFAKRALHQSVEFTHVDPALPSPMRRVFAQATKDLIREKTSKLGGCMSSELSDYLQDYGDSSSKKQLIKKISTRHIKGSCPNAEDEFIKVYTQIQNGDEDGEHPIVSVIHQEDGTPVALRKYYDVSTALLLEDCQDEHGIPIPAGSIVQVPELNQELELSGKSGKFLSTLYKSFKIPDGEVFMCSPLRLSPWASRESADRAVFAVDDDNMGALTVSHKRLRHCCDYTISDFRDVAKQVIQLCQAS